MGIRILKPYTASTRHRSVSEFAEITKSKPEKLLTTWKSRSTGRNNRGIITCRHRGGGHKKLYRTVDFKRGKLGVVGTAISIEYDPYRNARIALVLYPDNTKTYILHPRGLEVGDNVISAKDAPILVGNCLPLQAIPLGTTIHNVELHAGGGGQLARAAGSYVQIIAKEGRFITLRLPSGEVRLVANNCWATVGQVGNVDAINIRVGKAGRQRWLGKRPKVRGVVMNPNDHPHGGGEGRSPIGRKYPVSLWGRPALGERTRKAKKYSNGSIMKRRKSS